MANAGITAEGLVCDYPGGVRALDGLDLEISPGAIYGLLGPNGAGKSTTVHILTTLLPPTGGSARVGGHDVVRDASRVRGLIGATLQEVALDPLLTAREHLKFQAALQGLPRGRRDARTNELLEYVGLTDAADRRIRGYSGGMKRRLDLALALVHRPAVLFLDEPTTGLDVQSRTAIWDEVRSLAHEHGVTVLLTTQYLEEADALAERVGIVDHGRIVTEGAPAALKAEIGAGILRVTPADDSQRPGVAAVLARFGERAGNSHDGEAVRLASGGPGVAAIVRALDDEGLSIAQMELDLPTLDDVFLAKTGRWLEGSSNGDGRG